jgi:hypothetical protein
MTTITTVLRHARANAVAYLALFVALGGTSIAAVDLARHSITPDKLSPTQFGGYVRAWASVAASGRVVASGGRVTVKMQASAPGDYLISWRTKPATGCVALADVDVRGVSSTGPIPGYALAEASRPSGRDAKSIVHTYNAQGQQSALPFDVALLCSTPR